MYFLVVILYINGDTDTYIGFTGDDIEIFAGGESIY